MERENRPNAVKQAQEHLNEARPVVLTSHRPNKAPLKFTEEEIDVENEFWIATHRFGGRELGC